MAKRAIVLLSGGLDSAVTLHIALHKGYDCRCLIFDYGQRHRKEIRHAVKIAKGADCAYSVIKLLFPWGGSALLDKKMPLPKRSVEKIGRDVPATYVPSRNTVFLSVAASMAEAIDATAVFIGANALDYSGYPDCRPEYFEAFEALLEKGTKKGLSGHRIKIMTPLINKTKAEIVKIGRRLKAPYHLTWSCYAGKRTPCMECDSCVLREKGFHEAGIRDPLV